VQESRDSCGAEGLLSIDPSATDLTFGQMDGVALKTEEFNNSWKTKLYAYLDDQIKLSEASLKKWFQVELSVPSPLPLSHPWPD
jgi:hypothetical protein